MIDIHSHIVYDVDDGSKDLESSINILKEASIAGFNKIILTPHYMEDYYTVSKEEIAERIKVLKDACKKQEVDVELYQGNEIYITNHIDEYIKEDIASSLNDSKYVLFETPLNIEPSNLIEVIYKIKEIGKVPVLAHPERYSYIQSNPNKLLEFFEMGVLFQANYGSIIGLYGRNAKKTVKLLLKNNFIHFLGSDVHREDSIYTSMEEIMSELNKLIGEEKVYELTEKNTEKILNDEVLEIEEPSQIKLGFFSKLF